MRPLWDERYQPADAEIVKKKARQMMGRRTLRDCQLEDIEQEMALHVVRQSHRHRPDLGSREGFVGKTAKNALLNLIDKRSAKKRDDRRNIEYDDGPEGALADGESTQEQIDLELDLKDVVKRMSPDLQEVYALRLAGHSEAEMQDLLTLTRARVRVLIQRMEQHLKDSGLDPHSED